MFPRRPTVPHYTFSDTNYSHLLSETKLRTYGDAAEATAPALRILGARRAGDARCE